MAKGDVQGREGACMCARARVHGRVVSVALGEGVDHPEPVSEAMHGPGARQLGEEELLTTRAFPSLAKRMQ